MISYLMHCQTAALKDPQQEIVDIDNDFIEFGGDYPNWKWVVGVYKSLTQVRFVRVPNRSMPTLNVAVSRYVCFNIAVVTDMWQ